MNSAVRKLRLSLILVVVLACTGFVVCILLNIGTSRERSTGFLLALVIAGIFGSSAMKAAVRQDKSTGIVLQRYPTGTQLYLFGILFPLVYLLAVRGRRDYFTRFHCFQCLLLFALWLPVLLVRVPHGQKAQTVLGFYCLVGWLVAMIAAARGKTLRLPVLGQLADRLARR